MSDLRAAARLEYEGQINDDPDQRADFPRMMYKATKDEARQMQTDALAKCGETWIVTNLYDGLLCDTRVADNPHDAEAMAGEGWDFSPRAAHGLADGLIAATTAKDDRIAQLEAMLAEREGTPVNPDAPRRGRPPKSLTEVQDEAAA